MKRAAALGALVGCVAGALAACAGGARDVIPQSRDVRTDASAPVSASPDGYAYVARRARGVVALAEARGVAPDAAREAVDHLADQLDACAARLANEGKLAPDGAGRVVAQIDGDGRVGGLNVKAAPGGLVAANLLLCVVSPLRLLVFPAEDAGARGIAIEATWGAPIAGPPGAPPAPPASTAPVAPAAP